MSEQDNIEQRWRTIAEQLGLTCEQEPPSSVPPPRPAPPPPPPVVRAPEPPPPPAPEPEPVPLVEEGQPIAEAAPPTVPEVEAVVSFSGVVVTAEPQEPISQEGEPVDDERRGRSGRRRRGRRSGRNRERANEVAPSAARAPEGEASRGAPEEERRPTRRRRGRGRDEVREEVEELEPIAAEDDEVVADEPPPVVEEDDDELDEELDTLSNWNVPSWQELIASLYRPER